MIQVGEFKVVRLETHWCVSVKRSHGWEVRAEVDTEKEAACLAYRYLSEEFDVTIEEVAS